MEELKLFRRCGLADNPVLRPVLRKELADELEADVNRSKPSRTENHTLNISNFI